MEWYFWKNCNKVSVGKKMSWLYIMYNVRWLTLIFHWKSLRANVSFSTTSFYTHRRLSMKVSIMDVSVFIHSSILHFKSWLGTCLEVILLCLVLVQSEITHWTLISFNPVSVRVYFYPEVIYCNNCLSKTICLFGFDLVYSQRTVYHLKLESQNSTCSAQFLILFLRTLDFWQADTWMQTYFLRQFGDFILGKRALYIGVFHWKKAEIPIMNVHWPAELEWCCGE